MRKTIGTIGITTLLTGLATVSAWALMQVYVNLNTRVSTVEESVSMQQASIASITTQSQDTNQKVNALYDYFLKKGLNTTN